MLLLFKWQASLPLFPRPWHADCRLSPDHLIFISLLQLVICLASLRYDTPFMETVATFKYHELLEKHFILCFEPFEQLVLRRVGLLLRHLLFIFIQI